jgi:cation transport protein ChaC
MLVWRREMVVNSYIPRWVKVRSGKDQMYAIAFTINRSHPSYAGNIAPDMIVHHIATAHGRLGSCADYLNHTIDGLAQAGIHDQELLALQRQVHAKQQLLQQSLP